MSKKYNKKILIIIGIVILISLGLWQGIQKVEASWLSSDWRYRKAVTVNNTGNTSNLTNYQVSITIDTASLISTGKMRSDCGDIRFTDADGTTNLNYWIESGCNTASTKVWVKVPSIPASSSKTIYMYYGNPTATSQSNGDDTFAFFDDFNDGIIDTVKWPTATRDTTGFTESNGYLNGSNTTGYLTSNVALTGNYIQETLHQRTTDATNGYQSAGFYISTSDAYGILIHPTNRWYIQSDGAWNGPYATYTSTGWVRIKVVAIGSGSYIQLSQTLNTSQSVSNGGLSSEYVRLGRRYDDICTGQTYAGKWDWLLVRKYTSPEPTVQVGSEESANQPPTITSVSDAPDPVMTDNNITFTVNWNDPDSGDQIKIHICKTNAIAGQDCTGGSWCDSSSFTPLSPTNCTYPVTEADLGTKNYYAFVCDDSNACSSSTSGTFEVRAGYSQSVCISVPTSRTITCAYRSGNCQAGETTLCSISGDTNAHIGSPDTYNIKVCCKTR